MEQLATLTQLSQLRQLRSEVMALEQEISNLCYQHTSESKQQVISLTAVLKLKLDKLAELRAK